MYWRSSTTKTSHNSSIPFLPQVCCYLLQLISIFQKTVDIPFKTHTLTNTSVSHSLSYSFALLPSTAVFQPSQKKTFTSSLCCRPKDINTGENTTSFKKFRASLAYQHLVIKFNTIMNSSNNTSRSKIKLCLILRISYHVDYSLYSTIWFIHCCEYRLKNCYDFSRRWKIDNVILFLSLEIKKW